MDVELLPCEATTGWSADPGVTVATTEWPDLISGLHQSSLFLKFTAGGEAWYTFPAPVDVSKAQWLTLSLASMRRPSGQIRTRAAATYAIVLTLDGAPVRFEVPTFGVLTRVPLPLGGALLLTAVRIVAVHGADDWLVVSDLRAARDEMPLDLLASVAAGLRAQRDILLGRGMPVGTLTCAAGATKVSVDTDWSWLERYAVFSVGEGATYEEHQADNAVGPEFTMSRGFDGQAMLYAHDADQVYVTFPIEVGRLDVEARLPGLCVWFTSPGPATRTARLQEQVECFSPGGAVVRRDGARVSWRVMIDHEARSPELIAYMTQACRNFLAGGVVWVHGIRYWFEWSEPAVDAEPDSAYDIIPKSAYALTVEVREDSWQPKTTPTLSATDLAVIPER